VGGEKAWAGTVTPRSGSDEGAIAEFSFGPLAALGVTAIFRAYRTGKEYGHR
jgi:hypothetical protein